MDVKRAGEAALRAASAAASVPVVLLDGETIEREFGWVFFYQARELVVDGVASARIYGAPPVIVNRYTGRATMTGTSFSVDDYIEAYEALGAERFEAGEWRAFLMSKVDPLD